MILLCVGNSVEFTSAETALTETQQKIKIEDIDGNLICQANMRAFLNDKMKEFTEFLDQNYENKSSTESLTKAAFDKYEEFRAVAYEEYMEYIPVENQALAIAGTAFSQCEEIIQTNLDQARKMIERKSVTSSAVKRTTAITDKYQAINDQLDNLSKEFAMMKSYFETFAQKVPCYIDICI